MARPVKASGLERLPTMPANWSRSKLGFEATVKARLGWKGLKADEYVEDGYVLLATPNIKGREIDFENANFITRERYVESPEIMLREGDVLLTKDGFTLGTVNVVRRLPRPTTLNGSIALIRPKAALHSVFLYYLLASDFFQYLVHMMKDGMDILHLFQADLRHFDVLLPPRSEQVQIASFLDRKTAAVDTLVAKKERMIELLQEKRQALIVQAVTKGLDQKMSMKESGVEWIGSVPAHWTVKMLKRDTIVRRGASPRPIDDPKFFDPNGTYAWVRISDVTASGDGVLRQTEQQLSALGASLSVKLKRGDIFLSIAGSVGKACIGDIPCCIHDGFVYFPRLSMVPRFLKYIFDAGEAYRGLGKLGTQLNLNTDTVGAIALPFPPRAEQDAIAAWLDRVGAGIVQTMQRLDDQVQRLREYRQALITAAVTGKIDVSQEAA